MLYDGCVICNHGSRGGESLVHLKNDSLMCWLCIDDLQDEFDFCKELIEWNELNRIESEEEDV
jgi:hypothetical protein